jgi:hypothetical protein
MKAVKLTVEQWHLIRAELHSEYPLSVFLMRDRMKAKLGFTVREHNEYDPALQRNKFSIHLDFFSENKQTMFLLKFSEIINK